MVPLRPYTIVALVHSTHDNAVGDIADKKQFPRQIVTDHDGSTQEQDFL